MNLLRISKLNPRLKIISSISKRSLFITVDDHQPNPDALRFLPNLPENKPVMEKGGFIHFENLTAARTSPLATRLFQIDGVKEVSLGPDFITITRENESHLWQVVKPHVFGTLTDFFMSNLPVISDEVQVTSTLDILEDDDEIVQLIKQLLEERIRPYLLDDGGDLEYINFDPVSGHLSLKLVGACGTCPSSTETMQGGIEGMMKYYVPEVTKVIQVQSEVEKIAEDEFAKFEAKLNEAKKAEQKEEEKIEQVKKEKAKERYTVDKIVSEPDELDHVFHMIRPRPKEEQK